ncbi:MAG: histidine kinase N-terminal 7TM domain-containing protein [Salinirussus sp.]
MAWQSTPWADPLLFSTVVSATLAVFGLLYVLLVRGDRRVVAFAALMLGAAVWTLGYSFQFASATLPEKVTWATVATLGEAVVPAAWCTFALVYTRHEEWITRERVALLWAVPFLTVVLALSNGTHGLVRAGASLAPAPGGGYVVLDATGGPWLLVHGGYSYLIAFAGVVLMTDLIARSRRVYRGQAAVLLVGILVPAGANLVSLAGLGPGAVVDLTAPSMSVLGAAFAVGIFKYRLFDLVPVARSAVVENMREGYVLLDDGDDVVDLNAAARSLLDGDEGRLLGRDARSAFGVDLSVLDVEPGVEPAGDGTERATTTVRTGGPSSQRYLDLSVSTVEAGRVTGRVLAVRDVTDRIRLERRFRTLIEASSDIVFVLDDEGDIEYASPSVERILGYDPAELVEDRSFESLVVDDRDRDDGAPTTASEDDDRGEGSEAGEQTTAARTWHRMLEGHGPDPANSSRIRFEVRLRTASGTPRTIEAIARYLVDDPAVEGIVINARDVTQRKQREMELERTNERLDQFVSFVSHDLRNPLNVAMGNLELARETGEEGPLETVAQQHDRMATMIEDLLSMARDGRDVEETSPVALDAVATRAWECVDTGNATLAVETDARIMSEGARLSNLFENLFRNAVEHGVPDENGDDGLTVRIEALPDGFAVSDDGVGIPAEIREEVTESGYTTESGNTGYGLAIVGEIATAHGWEIAVTESAAGGARFEFTDVERPPDGEPSDQEPESGSGSGTKPAGERTAVNGDGAGEPVSPGGE